MGARTAPQPQPPLALTLFPCPQPLGFRTTLCLPPPFTPSIPDPSSQLGGGCSLSPPYRHACSRRTNLNRLGPRRRPRPTSLAR
eukprot:scaffold313_cov86-Isochrysis_galbana.AAC.4